ncbi:MAG: hypothetical protein ACRD8W_01160 [Nitrososphaeraceae archaeon]
MGIIVRFFDYVVGRLEGKYVASDPLLFRKNNGNNIGNPRSNVISSIHLPSHISFGDSIAGREGNQMVPNQRPLMQVKDSRYVLSDLDYMIDLVSRAQKIRNLNLMQQSPEITLRAISPDSWNIPYGVETSTFVTQQFDNAYIFGYREEVCPCCIYDAIYQLEFREGSIENRIWSTNHKCDPQVAAVYEKESRGIEYVEACDSMPSKLVPIVRGWLKDNINIFAIKLPQLFDIHKGLIEITRPTDPSRSFCVPFLKEEILVKCTDNRTYWVARVVANENKPTPIDGGEELLNFLDVVRGSTFGVFNICSAGGLGYRSEYYLIYLGKEATTVQVHADR